MERPEYYEGDVLTFFGEKIPERELYEHLAACMDQELPESSVKVQKSQISFYNKHLFAAVSLPVRRKKDWPERCIVVTIGLAHPLESPRAAVKVEPYPGRWTNHVLVSRMEEVNGELMDWLKEAYEFAQAKSRRGKSKFS